MSIRIKDAVRGLLDFPRKGKIGRVNGTRELIVHPNYIVVYALEDDEIKILAILHAARQYPQF